MRALLDRVERPEALSLVIAAMVSYSLRDFDYHSLNEVVGSLGFATSSLAALLVLAVSGLVALFFYFVFSAAAAAAGRMMLGGKGTWADVRLAVAWGLAPQIWAFLFRLPAVLLWPGAVSILRGSGRRIEIGSISFTPYFSEDVPLYQVLILLCLELGFFLWYLAVGSQTLAEAQGFSSLRGLANLLLAVVLPFAALMVIAAALVLTNWSGS